MHNDDLTITDRERAQAAALAERLGDPAAARALGLDLGSFLRVLLGRRVRRGTVVLLRHGLSQIGVGERTAAA